MDYIQPYVYLAPGSKEFTKHKTEIPVSPGCVRVVCISDTHNEQDSLQLPWGHLLVHSGDILTESGLRHIKDKNTSPKATSAGIELFERFSQWLATVPHPHKAFIGGNHDWVLQAMGPQKVNEILQKYNKKGSAIYLEKSEAMVGNVKIYGSPFDHWGGHNDAFMDTNPDWNNMTPNTHIVLTHMPPILPRNGGGVRENGPLIVAMAKNKVKLSVSGHCHWAHGLYIASLSAIPCVVASVCDSHWKMHPDLQVGPSGKRGDKVDLVNGGYNLKFPIIVCDLLIPGGPPSPNDEWVTGKAMPAVRTTLTASQERLLKGKPSLLFFGPPTDPEAVHRLVPLLENFYDVEHFDDAGEAVHAINSRAVPFNACIAKLGSKGNLGASVMAALAAKSKSTLIIVHSATARKSEDSCSRLQAEYGVYLVCDHHSEAEMVEILKKASQPK